MQSASVFHVGIPVVTILPFAPQGLPRFQHHRDSATTSVERPADPRPPLACPQTSSIAHLGHTEMKAAPLCGEPPDIAETLLRAPIALLKEGYVGSSLAASSAMNLADGPPASRQ